MPFYTDPIENLYSYQGNVPVTAPNRIRLEDGSTKTDITTFSDEELLLNGWTGPYTKPSWDMETETCSWDEDNLQFVVRKNPDPSPEQLEGSFRGLRESKLKSTDWTVLIDSPLTDSEKNLMLHYRQELRDIPANYDITNMTMEDYNNIPWPKYPI